MEPPITRRCRVLPAAGRPKAAFDEPAARALDKRAAGSFDGILTNSSTPSLPSPKSPPPPLPEPALPPSSSSVPRRPSVLSSNRTPLSTDSPDAAPLPRCTNVRCVEAGPFWGVHSIDTLLNRRGSSCLRGNGPAPPVTAVAADEDKTEADEALRIGRRVISPPKDARRDDCPPLLLPLREERGIGEAVLVSIGSYSAGDPGPEAPAPSSGASAALDAPTG